MHLAALMNLFLTFQIIEGPKNHIIEKADSKEKASNPLQRVRKTVAENTNLLKGKHIDQNARESTLLNFIQSNHGKKFKSGYTKGGDNVVHQKSHYELAEEFFILAQDISQIIIYPYGLNLFHVVSLYLPFKEFIRVCV